MAEIFEKEWDSLEDYDEEIEKLDHYKIHPEMMPYIGRNYEKTHILILGESHYLNAKETKVHLGKWYEEATGEEFKYPKNFDTRYVVWTYLNRRRTKAHSMFRNPAKALIDSWELGSAINDSEAFTAFAFLNYFLRPAKAEGKTIKVERVDEEKAYENLVELAEIIKPRITIFLSKKASDSFERKRKEYNGEVVNIGEVVCIAHPTCPHWNKAEGKKKLIEKLSEYKTCKLACDFKENGKLTIDRVKDVIKGYTIVRERQTKHRKGEITVRIYPSEKNGLVDEVVWHFFEGETKLGIGYVVPTRTIWIWNYTEKRYRKKDDLKGESRKIYNDVTQLIREM